MFGLLNILLSLPAPLLLLGIGLMIASAIHVVRTGRELFWVWIILLFPGLGALVYFLAVWLPDLLTGRAARDIGQAASKALDPEREYRQARAALDDADTVGNRMRFAQAAAGLGRWPEAEDAWRRCVVGQFADDPVVILGHANALLELGRYEEALARLETMKAEDAETGPGALAYARAYEGLGRDGEAEAPYRFAADRIPGLEAAGRYAAFLAKIGKRDEAQAAFDEIERRYVKISPKLRGREKPWRDMAARAVGR